MSADTFSVRGKQVVVVGAARSGIAAAELLLRRGARVTLQDVKTQIDEEERMRAAGVELELGGHNESTLLAADLIVLSPGVPAQQPALAAARRLGVPMVGELELASRWLRGRIVAITGTKGKSTTTTLTGRMLEAGGRRVLVGGNIGRALSAQVDESTDDTIHVVEASSFQLETTETLRPWIAVLLNFSPDHLDRHASVEEYAQAKARIFANQAETDWAVLNADDVPALDLAGGVRAQRLLFSTTVSLAEGVAISGGVIGRRTGGTVQPLVPLSAIRLLGPHLVSDVAAATAVASIVGVDGASMTRAVSTFAGLEHALEPVAEIGGVRFVNDSKATNVDAARRAIESFDEGLVVIMGGRFKGGSFRDLADALAARHATVIAIGEASGLIHEAFADVVDVRDASDMPSAVRTAFACAAPGRTVVLAPACASFDMFRDYADRGKVFKQEVRRLQDEFANTREQ
jgi:UDP-N-acetylmuramoylalanine--D-glutamate ligase